MNCPQNIARILVEIIQIALLRSRAAGWSGDARRCAVEADHVHNLPRLLLDYSPELLRYYWEVSKPGYEQETGAPDPGFQPLWDALERQLGCCQPAEAP